MLGLTSGELFVVLFILFAVVSAPWWPRLGEALGRAVAGTGKPDPPASEMDDETTNE